MRFSGQKSVTEIAASARLRSIGRLIIKNVLTDGFSTPILPVNVQLEVLRSLLSQVTTLSSRKTGELALQTMSAVSLNEGSKVCDDGSGEARFVAELVEDGTLRRLFPPPT
jgi:hypothetical protein